MNHAESTSNKISMFGIKIDAVRMPEAVSRLQDWIRRADGQCRYVVTPNVDHSVLFQQHEGLRQAYADAELVTADGMPVVLASRLLRRPLPERVTGADLAPALFSATSNSQGLRVFLLGAKPGVAEKAAKNIEARWPAVEVVGTYSPPFDFVRDQEENCKILEMVNATHCDVLLVGLGAPKQELWVHKNHHGLNAKVAMCIGATIDFLAGEKPRAPGWMQATGLEWLHRCASEPRRLLQRYLTGAILFPRLVFREWLEPIEHQSNASPVQRQK